MDEQVYYIKIKKEYASALIEDLQQVDAIEIVSEGIPEWQKTETLKRLDQLNANPATAISEEAFLKVLNDGDE